MSLLGGLENMFGDIAGFDIPFYGEKDWTIQVPKNLDVTPEPDNWWGELKQSVKSGIDSVISSVASWAGYEKKPKEWVDIASFESFISLDGVSDSQIVENAVENGSFRSVNKINRPRTFVVELGQGGSTSKIENILSNLRKYQGNGSLIVGSKAVYRGDTLCRLLTPYGVVEDLNLKTINYTFDRDGGSNLLIVRLTFQEIKQSYTLTDYTVEKVKDPSTADTSNTGKKALGGL